VQIIEVSRGSHHKRSAKSRRALLLAAVLVCCGALASVALAAAIDFVEPSSSPETAGDQPQRIVAADFDGDGDQDLVTQNYGDANLTILRNNGAANFSAPRPVWSGTPHRVILGLTAADLDGDGDQDLAVGRYDRVSILRNNGAGRFSEPASSPVTVTPPGGAVRDVAAADFDGDLDQDLAVAQIGGSRGYGKILFNDGTGDFNSSEFGLWRAGDYPERIAVGDIDVDGDQDLAVANLQSDDVTVLRNTGAGDFEEPPSSPEAVGQAPHGIALPDVDGDGDLDLVVANGGGNVSILKRRGNVNFFEATSSPEPLGGSPHCVVASDFDGDGDQDLAATWTGGVSILRNANEGNFVEVPSSPEVPGTGAYELVAPDLDGDGDPDLATVNLISDSVTILLNQ
jgi:hypothetical protein